VTDVYCSVEFSHCHLPSLLLTGCAWYWLLFTLCTEISQHCELTGVEALLMQAQLHWSGHLVCRMHNFLRPSSTAGSPLEADHVVTHITVQGLTEENPSAVQHRYSNYLCYYWRVWKVSVPRGADIPKGHHSEGPPFSATFSSDNLRLAIRLGLVSVVCSWQYQECSLQQPWMAAFRMADLFGMVDPNRVES